MVWLQNRRKIRYRIFQLRSAEEATRDATAKDEVLQRAAEERRERARDDELRIGRSKRR